MKFFNFSIDDKPAWKIILRGAAVPGLITGACIIIAVIMAFFQEWDFNNNIKVGVVVGLFFSLWGGLEVAFGLLFWGGSKRTNFYLFLGYMLTWVFSIALIFKL